MSDIETAARPYAKAIFELADESKALTEWSNVLQLASMVASDETMQATIASPSVLASQVSDLFVDIMSSAEGAPEISQQARNLIRLLSENGRFTALPAIADIYEELKQQAEGTLEVKVTSARELTAKQEKEMAKNLQKRLGKEVSITAEIDESLIGGAVIRAGDLVIDGSARGRLNKLTSTLNK